jgi:hypothetical protein
MHNSSIAGIFNIPTADVVESATPIHWGLITPIELECIEELSKLLVEKALAAKSQRSLPQNISSFESTTPTITIDSMTEIDDEPSNTEPAPEQPEAPPPNWKNGERIPRGQPPRPIPFYRKGQKW